MNNRVGLGLVGCGRAVERLYVPALREVESVHAVGVTDVNTERRALIVEQLPDAQAYESLDAMLENPAIEAVVIATPPGTHTELARRALVAGRWALIEKPLAETLVEGLTLGELGEDATRRIMLGYNRRFWTPMIRLREVIANQRIGNARDDASMRVSIEFSINANDWNAVAGTVDPLDDLASHYLDLLRFVFDADCVSVAAERPHPRAVRLNVRMSNDVEVEMHHEHGEQTREHFRVQSNGRVFEARMGSLRISPAEGSMRTLLDRVDQVVRKLRGRGWTLGRSYADQIETFARHVRSGEPASPGYKDGLAGLRSLDAAKRSADQQGGEVSINEEQ